MTSFTEQLNKQGRKCFYCNKPLTRRQATEDHYIPKSKGGPNGYENRVIACRDCDFKKGAEWPNLFHFQG